MVLWRPIRPFRTKSQKRCSFHYRGVECKSRKSRNTWSNRQIWPWSTEWSRAKSNRVLPRERTGIANTLLQQHKRRLYTWTSPDGQHRNQMDYIICSKRWRRSMLLLLLSLQSSPTLCDPIDGSPRGYPVPGILQKEHWSGLPFPSPMHESEKWKWSRSVVGDALYG